MIWFPFEQNTVHLEAVTQLHLVQAQKQCNFNKEFRDYSKLVKHCQSLQRENQHLKNQIRNLKAKLKTKKSLKTRRIKRRPESELVKNFNCLYPSCKKQYASELALNLHMKMKHNAGSKRQRDKLMKQIMQSEVQGSQRPHINLNLPPILMEVYRKTKQQPNYMKKTKKTQKIQSIQQSQHQ